MTGRHKWKWGAALGTALVVAQASLLAAFAGEWKVLEGGEYWQKSYVEADGSYTSDGWQQIDGKWYHFDQDGYVDVGMRTFDGKEYILMKSGAMEVSRDYGIGYVDENGVWNIQPKDPITNKNIFAECCRSWGIDIETVISGCLETDEITYSCSTGKFPKDSEGNYVYRVAVYGIQEAILDQLDNDGVAVNMTCRYDYDEAAGSFTTTISRSELDYGD